MHAVTLFLNHHADRSPRAAAWGLFLRLKLQSKNKGCHFPMISGHYSGLTLSHPSSLTDSWLREIKSHIYLPLCCSWDISNTYVYAYFLSGASLSLAMQSICPWPCHAACVPVPLVLCKHYGAELKCLRWFRLISILSWSSAVGNVLHHKGTSRMKVVPCWVATPSQMDFRPTGSGESPQIYFLSYILYYFLNILRSKKRLIYLTNSHQKKKGQRTSTFLNWFKYKHNVGSS